MSKKAAYNREMRCLLQDKEQNVKSKRFFNCKIINNDETLYG